MKKLYLECYTGISGDMVSGALLDLGADKEVLEKVLKTVPLKGFQIKISRIVKSGLDVCDFNVILDEELENHDHDMGFLYGDKMEGDCQEHENLDHEQHHFHRNLTEITEILKDTRMTDKARRTALHIFRILGEAEAKAHGTTAEQVHFHEAGAIDSIIDVIAAAVCLDNLNIDDVILPVLYEGCGFIHCQHGTLPVPVPAVLNIVEAHHLPICITKRRGELVTPTGAAIAAAIMTNDRLPKKFRIIKSGAGAGKRSYEIPSLLRAMLIEEII